jgi:hypothetical protein
VLAEIGTEHIEQIAILGRIRQIINGRHPRLAEDESPGTVGDGTFKPAVISMRDPLRKFVPHGALFRPPFFTERDRGIDDMLLECHAVFDFERPFLVVFNTNGGNLHLTKARGETGELVLLPIREGVIVALGTINPLAEERPHRATGELVHIEHIIRIGLRDVIRRRHAGPQTVGVDHLADDVIEPAILMQAIREPFGEPVAPENDELAPFGSNKPAG